MKHELLAPAGDKESLYQAIHNGADAVYVGLKDFGARSFATNFSNSEIIDAIKLCHLYGVKLYVTMNTLIKDKEVNYFLEQIEFLHKNGIDAVIMQDFGMICLVREMFPNLEIHASTQANNSSKETIELFHKLGVKRVVLPREMNLEEIKKIDIPIEKEVFIHGALCISYSGNCYMSSMLGNRSGNRGECVGNCRLKYSLKKNDTIVKKDQYLLSTKEFNTTTKFQDLLNTDIYSFKIEGRMKSPEYVGFVTNLYRKLIDQKDFYLDEELNKLKVLFNRGFTTGNLFEDKDIMNTNSSNHLGMEIGKVISVNPKKIVIKLFKDLNQEDGIRFYESKKGFIVNYLYDDKGNLISSAKDKVTLDNKIGLTTNDRVFKTIDRKLITELRKINLKKIYINLSLIAKKDKKLKIIIDDFKNILEVEGSIVEQAKTSSIDQNRIIKQLNKLGNTPFIAKDIKIDMDDNIFISIKELNELRRLAVDKLITVRCQNNNSFIKKEVNYQKLNISSSSYLTATIYTEEQLQTCLELDFQRIYVADLNLYNKYKSYEQVYYKIDRNPFVVKDVIQEKNLIGENILFNQYKNTYGDYFLNITNIYSAYYLLKNGLPLIPVSIELTKDEVLNLVNQFKKQFLFELPVEVVVYGRVCNMTIKGNILKLDHKFKYCLVDNKKNNFPVFFKNDRTYILNCSNNLVNYKDSLPVVKRFDFYDETKEKIVNIVNMLK